MIVGDRKTVWADVYQSGGLWHFNVHRVGEQCAIYASRYKDGHFERSDAIRHAENLLPGFGLRMDKPMVQEHPDYAEMGIFAGYGEVDFNISETDLENQL